MYIDILVLSLSDLFYTFEEFVVLIASQAMQERYGIIFIATGCGRVKD